MLFSCFSTNKYASLCFQGFTAPSCEIMYFLSMWTQITVKDKYHHLSVGVWSCQSIYVGFSLLLQLKELSAGFYSCKERHVVKLVKE